MTHSVNITLQELIDAIQFVNENEEYTITLHIDDTGIGTVKHVSKTEDWDNIKKWKNITDLNSW